MTLDLGLFLIPVFVFRSFYCRVTVLPLLPVFVGTGAGSLRLSVFVWTVFVSLFLCAGTDRVSV